MHSAAGLAKFCTMHSAAGLAKFLYNAQCCWFSQILLSLMYSLGTPGAVGFCLGTPGAVGFCLGTPGAVGFLKIFKVF